MTELNVNDFLKLQNYMSCLISCYICIILKLQNDIIRLLEIIKKKLYDDIMKYHKDAQRHFFSDIGEGDINDD